MVSKKVAKMAIFMIEINKLSVAVRIVLVEKIWDSIPKESDEFVLPDTDKRELDER